MEPAWLNPVEAVRKGRELTQTQAHSLRCASDALCHLKNLSARKPCSDSPVLPAQTNHFPYDVSPHQLFCYSHQKVTYAEPHNWTSSKRTEKKKNSTDETKNSGDWWNQGTMSSVEKLRQRTFWGTTKRRSTPESLVFQRNFCCVWKENLSANHPAKEHSQLVAWCTVGLPWCFSCHILLFILKKRKLESCFDWWHTIFLFAFFPQNFSHQITH